ncbi:protoheme IX farnesyltransferase [bacterium]|nr:protoheme IX farnesyltransferase [bacterium]
MSTTVEAAPNAVRPLATESVSLTGSQRLMDYLSLMRPRIALMVMITVSVGFLLGRQGEPTTAQLWHAIVGVVLVAAGSSAFNQWFEQTTDRRMRRTEDRPLPSGRMASAEVCGLGLTWAIVGCSYLAWTVNPLTAMLAGGTFLLYALVYTPLKRWTSLCTAVGAIPGAMPPVLGWTAAGQPLDVHAAALFGLMFFWQFPHFLAIAWLYRDDYASAGLRMLPGVHPQPHVTGLLATVYAVCLLPLSLLPGWLGLGGNAYLVVAFLLGSAYLAASVLFALQETRRSARRVVWVSLVYLPTVLATLALDHILGLTAG